MVVVTLTVAVVVVCRRPVAEVADAFDAAEIVGVVNNFTDDFTVTFTSPHTGWGCYVTSPAKGAGFVT